ncbi:MAG: hypothetical protein AABX51_05800 [Nanoarchaeota archaeon]
MTIKATLPGKETIDTVCQKLEEFGFETRIYYSQLQGNDSVNFYHLFKNDWIPIGIYVEKRSLFMIHFYPWLPESIREKVDGFLWEYGFLPPSLQLQ